MPKRKKFVIFLTISGKNRRESNIESDKLMFIGMFAQTKLGHCRGDQWSPATNGKNPINGRPLVAPTGLYDAISYHQTHR